MTPAALLFFNILVTLLIFLPRRYAALPILLSVFYMTGGPRIDIGSLTFYVNRLLILVGTLRIFLRREWPEAAPNKIDKAYYLWIIIMFFTGSLRTLEINTIINRAAQVFDAIGIYFLFRSFIQDTEDIKQVLHWITVLLIPLASIMLFERLGSYNIFSILGGVNEIPVLRGGRLRCQGPFANPILAGTAGATSLGFIFAYRFYNKNSVFTFSLGVLSSFIIVFVSNSSGPILSLMFIGVGSAFWFFRYKMKEFQIAFVIFLITIAVFMEAPIWYLIARIDLTGSSTGWHRAELINSAIMYFNEWWLLGTDYTRHWMPTGITWSPDHTDITNHYISMGVRGGLFTMLAFINIIVKGFNTIGIKINSFCIKREDQLMLWFLGTILFSHSVTFFSVRYFDQTIMLFYLLVALLSVINDSFDETSITSKS